MKGVSYLISDEGEKTHAVLDLSVWQEVWQALKAQTETPRQFGALRGEFEAAGFDVEGVGDALLEPVNEEDKLALTREAANDDAFLNDLNQTMRDFEHVDAEWWEPTE